MTDLSPCPFCGGAGHVVEDYGYEGRAPLLYRPQCKVCGGGLGGFSKRPEAIAAWNRRTAPASPPDGWVLVPREPTPEMIDRAVAFMLQVKLGGDYGWSAYARDVYGRMLSAAPASPEGGPTGHLDEPNPSPTTPDSRFSETAGAGERKSEGGAG